MELGWTVALWFGCDFRDPGRRELSYQFSRYVLARKGLRPSVTEASLPVGSRNYCPAGARQRRAKNCKYLLFGHLEATAIWRLECQKALRLLFESGVSFDYV